MKNSFLYICQKSLEEKIDGNIEILVSKEHGHNWGQMISFAIIIVRAKQSNVMSLNCFIKAYAVVNFVKELIWVFFIAKKYIHSPKPCRIYTVDRAELDCMAEFRL